MEPSILDDHFPEVKTLWRRVTRAAEAFFFTPASASPLAALRIGIAGVLLTQAWMLRKDALDFFASDGLIQGDLARYYAEPGAPHISWLVQTLAPLGVAEASCIQAVCALYVMSLLLLGAGLFTRIAAVLSWFTHWTLVNSASVMPYGLDHFAHIFLFYLMWIPAGRAYSLDVAWRHLSAAPRATARLALRVMQIHLCISYLSSGIEKATGIQWWNGELLWRAMSLPAYHQVDVSWLAEWPVISQLGGLTALAIELGYCVLIWPRRTRKLWIAGALALHIGIAVFMGLHLFGAIMCVLTLALFGFSPEPREPLEPSPAPCS